MPYERFGMKMDFLYRPQDYNSSNESQSVTQRCSYSLVRYTILSKTLVDYRSNYFEVQELKRSTSASVIHTFKVQFARYGILEVLLTEEHISAHLNLQHFPRRVDLSTRPQACTILSLIERGDSCTMFVKHCWKKN